jgi:hypothetical protein
MKYGLLALLGVPISLLIIGYLIFHYQLNSSFLV